MKTTVPMPPMPEPMPGPRREGLDSLYKADMAGFGGTMFGSSSGPLHDMFLSTADTRAHVTLLLPSGASRPGANRPAVSRTGKVTSLVPTCLFDDDDGPSGGGDNGGGDEFMFSDVLLQQLRMDNAMQGEVLSGASESGADFDMFPRASSADFAAMWDQAVFMSESEAASSFPLDDAMLAMQLGALSTHPGALQQQPEGTQHRPGGFLQMLSAGTMPQPLLNGTSAPGNALQQWAPCDAMVLHQAHEDEIAELLRSTHDQTVVDASYGGDFDDGRSKRVRHGAAACGGDTWQGGSPSSMQTGSMGPPAGGPGTAYVAAAHCMLRRMAITDSIGTVVASDGERSAALCEELALFMRSLDQSITNCLLHMEFSSQDAYMAVTGNITHFQDATLAVVQELLDLKSKTANQFTGALWNTRPACSNYSATAVWATPAGSSGGGPRPTVSGGGSGSGYGDGSVTSGGNYNNTTVATFEDSAAMGQRMHTNAVMCMDLRDKFIERFERTLKNSACQLWAMIHVVDPKPSRAVKQLLAVYTAKTHKQITDWFTNWRARHWRPGIHTLAQEMEQHDATSAAMVAALEAEAAGGQFEMGMAEWHGGR